MKSLAPIAEKIAARLIERHETIAVAESSTGGLIAAALLSVPGASAYFVGGAVVYTKVARAALLGIGDADMAGLRPSTEAYSLMLAGRVRERHGATWGIGETGATAPPAIATAMRRATPASRSQVRSKRRLRWRREAPTGRRTWKLSPSGRLSFWLKRCRQ